MNFRQVATEIMLHANEEKWYETRERIEEALANVADSLTVPELHALVGRRVAEVHAGRPTVSREQFECNAADRARDFRPPQPAFSIDHWRDQPDGVR